jgi:predicted DNA-binding WGR domain protein
MIERDLFGTIRLAHTWGRIGSTGQVAVYDSEEEAGEALEGGARAKRRRGTATYNLAEGCLWD